MRKVDNGDGDDDDKEVSDGAERPHGHDASAAQAGRAAGVPEPARAFGGPVPQALHQPADRLVRAKQGRLDRARRSIRPQRDSTQAPQVVLLSHVRGRPGHDSYYFDHISCHIIGVEFLSRRFTGNHLSNCTF